MLTQAAGWRLGLQAGLQLVAADLNAATDAILAVAKMVEEDPSSIVELDINPLLLLAKGQGVVAADALVSLREKYDE